LYLFWLEIRHFRGLEAAGSCLAYSPFLRNHRAMYRLPNSQEKTKIWHFYGSFPAANVPNGLAHKGEERINLNTLMKGLASGEAT
jgi:hypothetical protein